MNIDRTHLISISHSVNDHLGELWLAHNQRGSVQFSFGISQETFRQQVGGESLLDESPHPALVQVEQYLNGKRRQFNVCIDWDHMTDFQTKVYRAVMAVSYGQTATYQHIAGEIGQPKAYRAVGGANAANPLPLIIPCHRLVGSDGSLRGYGGAGGIKTKRWLLDLESQNRD